MSRQVRWRLYRCVGSDTEIVLVASGGTEVARWPLPATRPPDLSVVDALARLQLRARRSRCTIRVLNPSPELVELLTLVGLTGSRRRSWVRIPDSTKENAHGEDPA